MKKKLGLMLFSVLLTVMFTIGIQTTVMAAGQKLYSFERNGFDANAQLIYVLDYNSSNLRTCVLRSSGSSQDSNPTFAKMNASTFNSEIGEFPSVDCKLWYNSGSGWHRVESSMSPKPELVKNSDLVRKCNHHNYRSNVIYLCGLDDGGAFVEKYNRETCADVGFEYLSASSFRGGELVPEAIGYIFHENTDDKFESCRNPDNPEKKAIFKIEGDIGKVWGIYSPRGHYPENPDKEMYGIIGSATYDPSNYEYVKVWVYPYPEDLDEYEIESITCDNPDVVCGTATKDTSKNAYRYELKDFTHLFDDLNDLTFTVKFKGGSPSPDPGPKPDPKPGPNPKPSPDNNQTNDYMMSAYLRNMLKESSKSDEGSAKKKDTVVDKDTYKSSVPSKTVTALDATNKLDMDLKVHPSSEKSITNQNFLANYFAGQLGVKAKIINTDDVFMRNDLLTARYGQKDKLCWNELNYKIPGAVYAVVYNQTDGAYLISGIIDANGNAVFEGFILRPASTVTIFAAN